MYAHKRNGVLPWARKERFKSQKSSVTTDTNWESFGALRKEVKKIGIMTRMEDRAKTRLAINSQPRSSSSMHQRTPKTRPSNLKAVEQ
jgi:hypothetical protein